MFSGERERERGGGKVGLTLPRSKCCCCLSGAVCGSWSAVLGGQPPPGARVVAVERSNKVSNAVLPMGTVEEPEP